MAAVNLPHSDGIDPPDAIPSVGGLPAAVGLGLRRERADALLAGGAGIGSLEIHAENYMVDGGPTLAMLSRLREDYPLSLHGVALSLGGNAPLDREHLRRLKHLIDRFEPASFSEHLAWSSHSGTCFDDLLPIAYNAATLRRVADRIDEAQDVLDMQLLLENPSSYLTFADSDWDEVEFLAEIVRRTGCGLLLDVNNVVVSAHNLGFDPTGYIDRFPLARVGEIHIAGHDAVAGEGGETVLVDAQASAVGEAAWNLLARALHRTGPAPVLLERDGNVPPLMALQPELGRARSLIAAAREHRHAA